MTESANSEAKVQEHYGRGGLLARLDAALTQAGVDPARATVDDLVPFDQLHGRGIAATREHAERAGIDGAMHVLDLGAAPGSWAMYAAQKVGAGGKILAVDLEPLTTALPPSTIFVQGDAFALTSDALATFAPYDVVLSDMAPRTTGARITDQTRSYDLFMRALAVAATLGKPGGAFVGKIFMSDDLPHARAELRKHYATERIIRPEGTRANSIEIFVVGMEKRA